MYLLPAAAILTATLTTHHSPVTVHPGDTLATIAARGCGSAADWHGLAAASGIADPNRIYPGQRINYAGCHHSTRLAAYTTRPRQHDADDPDSDADDPGTHYAARHHNGYQAVSRTTGYTGRHRAAVSYRGSSGSFEACVIRTESGGNSRAVNSSSGAGGLYGFLPSTFHSLGYSGRPQDAPVSVQRQAFLRLYAQAGTSPWHASDGC